MNYLAYHLLDYIASSFDLMEVNEKMQQYKSNLQKFRMKTPLTLFYNVVRKRRMRPSANFQEMVGEFEWPENVTLEVVEQFRQEYVAHYNLHKCTMIVAEVCPASHVINNLVYSLVSC